jgi:hypothetical protein
VRILLYLPLCLVTIGLVCEVNAQVDQRKVGPAPKTNSMQFGPSVSSKSRAGTDEEIRGRGREWYVQCLSDWDRETHMSKSEWQRTCRRVALERAQFLINEEAKKQGK